MIRLKEQIWLWVYGIVSGLLAFLLAGAGHGTMTLLQLVGSPFTALGPYGLGFGMIVGPLQWGLLGTLYSRRIIGRKFLIGFLLLHYAFAAVLLTKFWDWEYARRISLGMLVVGFGFYATGQVYLWWVILRKSRLVELSRTADPSLRS